MTIDRYVVPPGGFGQMAAATLLELLADCESPVVGLATGNTPLGMYSSLREAVDGGRADLHSVRPFALDEYVGDPNHPCSNRSYFARRWESIPGARQVVQFDPAARDLAADVRRMVTHLDDPGGLDVALVGIGTNGHLAFNEPGSSIDAPARVVELTEASRAAARPCWQAATPTRGMTLGMSEIMAARRVLLLANGAGKASIVARAFEGEPSADCPASWLQLHPAVTVVLDSDAYRR